MPKGFPNLWIRLIVVCLTPAAGQLLRRSLHLTPFQMVPCTLFHSIGQCRPSLLQNPLQRVPQRTLAIWHPSQSQSRGTSHLWLTVVPNWLEGQWVWCAWVGADCSMSLFLWSACSSGFLRFFLMMTSQSGVYLQRRLRYSWRDSSRNAISSPFWYHLCL